MCAYKKKQTHNSSQIKRDSRRSLCQGDHHQSIITYSGKIQLHLQSLVDAFVKPNMFQSEEEKNEVDAFGGCIKLHKIQSKYK